MIDIARIFAKYYRPQSDLFQLVWKHSQQVAQLAQEIALAHQQLDIDYTFLYEAAMLHDIGVFRTHAPSILCNGEAPYLQHGVIGAELLRSEGLEAHALVCERHIGVGLTVEDIVRQNLPLPQRDMLPVTIEEKLVCYADNFFSKSHPTRMRTYEQVRSSVARFGENNLLRFDALAQLFGKVNERY
ncbi:MAG: HDIG domain-containing protein [Bacteroidaceae bacterium]|nr:HDIG domain-containing protein [Bacteroidaceae bacterium]